MPLQYTAAFDRLDATRQKVLCRLDEIRRVDGAGEVFRFSHSKLQSRLEQAGHVLTTNGQQVLARASPMMRVRRSDAAKRDDGFEEAIWKMEQAAWTLPQLALLISVATLGRSYLAEFVGRARRIVECLGKLRLVFEMQWSSEQVVYYAKTILWCPLREYEPLPVDLVALAKAKLGACHKQLKACVKELHELDADPRDDEEVDIEVEGDNLVDDDGEDEWMRVQISFVSVPLLAQAVESDENDVGPASMLFPTGERRRRRSVPGTGVEQILARKASVLLKLVRGLLKKMRHKCVPSSIPMAAVPWIDVLLEFAAAIADTADTLLANLCRSFVGYASQDALRLGQLAIKAAEHARVKCGDNPYHHHQVWFDRWQGEAELAVQPFIDYLPPR